MKKPTRSALVGITLGLVLTISGFIVGYQSRSIWPQSDEQFDILRQAQTFLNTHYLEDLPAPIVLERGMIRGMVEALEDPYTTYNEPVAHEIQTDELAGEYGGIGAFISRNEQGSVYLIPFKDGPASKAGILDGDVLVAIDGDHLEGSMTLDVISSMLRGPDGTLVTLTIAPRGDDLENLVFEIERAVIPLPSLTEYLLPSNPQIGVIVVTLFSERTPDELAEVYAQYEQVGVKGLILDLRGNGGGLLESGVSVAEFFLSEGIILIEQKRGGLEEESRVEIAGPASEIPLVVLVNEQTASAAEIVAGAIQANDRGPVMGQTTFGKGSVQVILELRDGSSLHVTSSRWLTPDRGLLDGVGLIPNVLVSDSGTDVDDALVTAAEWIQTQWGALE